MVELTLENWEEEVTNAQGLVLIDWWGVSCELCIAIMPMVQELAKEYEGKVAFKKFDASQKGVKRFCIQHRIMGLPVINLWKNGEKIDEIVKEECTKEGIIALINKHL